MTDDTGSTPETPTLHPLCALFPPLAGDELQALADDIKQHGLHQPILRTADWQIIDGQGRLAACELAGVEPTYEIWDGAGSLIDVVVSRNLRRRHLDTSQRAMIASHLAERVADERGDVGARANLPAKRQGRRRDDAAAIMNVSPRSVEDARVIRRKGVPELAERVQRGEITVHSAKKIARQPKPTQRQILKKGPSGTGRTRKTRRASTSPKATANPPTSEPTAVFHSRYAGPRYSVVYAELTGSTRTGEPASADATTGSSDLLTRTVSSPAVADDAVLLLLVSNPMLAAGMRIITDAGFAYALSVAVVRVFDADLPASEHHALLLFATKGTTPPSVEIVSSVVKSEESPDEAQESAMDVVDEIATGATVLTLAARSQRQGWVTLEEEVAPAAPPPATAPRLSPMPPSAVVAPLVPSADSPSGSAPSGACMIA